MTHVQRIRELFLRPRPAYAIAEAAELLGIERDEVRAWMESGELERIETEDGAMLPWEELVSFGMDFWSQEAVEQSLGAQAAETLPELLRLAHLEVRIPQMQIIALERLAAVDGKTVSAVLARELRDLVSVHSEWLSREVPGFAAALAWPDAAGL